MLFLFLSIACKPDMILVSMYLFMLNKLCLSLSLNSSPIQARVTKFGPEVQTTLVKIPIVLRSD